MSTPPVKPKRPLRTRIRSLFLALLVSALLIGLLLEIYARVVVGRFDLIHAYEFEPTSLGVLVPNTYDRLPRNFGKSPHRYGAFINRHGVRGALPDDFLSDDYSRVYMVGDSATFGTGVDDTETLPYLTQERLAELTGRKILIINAGTPGHGPVDHAYVVRRLAANARPQVVVLVLFSNDLQNLRKEPLGRLSGSRSARSLKNFTVELFNKGILKAPALIWMVVSIQTANRSPSIPDEEAYEILAASIDDIKRTCQEIDARLVVLLIPRAKIEDREPDHAFYRGIDSICDERSIDSYYLFAESGFVPGLAFPDDNHYTAEGNRMLSRILAPILADYLPETATSSGSPPAR